MHILLERNTKSLGEMYKCQQEQYWKGVKTTKIRVDVTTSSKRKETNAKTIATKHQLTIEHSMTDSLIDASDQIAT